MKYKAVISDLDGTLLNSKHEISDYSKRIIKRVIDRGIKFFIATGRHHIDADHIRRKLELDTILITSNGSRVHDVGREELLAYDIDDIIVQEILNMDIDGEIHANVYQGDSWFVQVETDWLVEFHRESGFRYEVMDFKKLEKYDASKLFFVCQDHEKLLLLKEKIEEQFIDRLNITFSFPACLEIMAHGVSKGTALKTVLNQYGIKAEEAIAFGDGLNDLEMLKLVGKGLIMGNAHEKLKEALPQNEIIQTNDENGVANYLKGLFMGN